MSEKQEIIKQMMDLQHKFIELERRGEFSTEEYYDTDGDSESGAAQTQLRGSGQAVGGPGPRGERFEALS